MLSNHISHHSHTTPPPEFNKGSDILNRKQNEGRKNHEINERDDPK